MRKILSTLAVICILVLSIFSNLSLISASTAEKGYKVYPYMAFALNRDSYANSTKVTMTADGGYTISKNPNNNTDNIAWFSFLAAGKADVAGYSSTLPYLYLNNIDTNAKFTIKAKFVDAADFVVNSDGAAAIYSAEEGALQSNSTIKIDLKQAMSLSSLPSGKILALIFEVEHNKSDKKVNLSSIWLGNDNISMSEISTADAVAINFTENDVVNEWGFNSALEKEGDGFILKKTADKSPAAMFRNEANFAVKDHPYIYIHIKEANIGGGQNVAEFILRNDITELIGSPTSPGGPIRLWPWASQELEVWYRIDLRHYLSENDINNNNMILATYFIMHGAAEGAINDKLRIGGVYYGDEKFNATKYTITAVAGANGSITPTSQVAHNQNKTFIITPDDGYEIDTLKVDGVVVQNPGLTYTFTSVASDHTIEVTFKKISGNTPQTPEDNTPAEKGFKVYPFELFQTGSAKLDMTADGYYKFSKGSSAGESGTFNFAVTNKAGLVDYDKLCYLHLLNKNSTGKFIVKAGFFPVTGYSSVPQTVVYESPDNLEPNKKITIDLKTVLSDANAWDHNGKILCLSIQLVHNGDASKVAEFDSIWLGTKKLDTSEKSSVDAVAFDFSDPTYIGNCEVTQEGQGFKMERGDLSKESYVVKDLEQGSRLSTPYVYINMKDMGAGNTVYFFFKDPDTIITGEPLRNEQIRLNPEVGDSNVWLRINLLDYMTEEEISSDKLILRTHISVYTSGSVADETLTFGGVFYGGELFKKGNTGGGNSDGGNTDGENSGKTPSNPATGYNVDWHVLIAMLCASAAVANIARKRSIWA